WVIGELSLEELWRMVDRIRVGSEGYALLVGEDGQLIAHGNPDEKRGIASGQTRTNPVLNFATRVRLDSSTPTNHQYRAQGGKEMLAVASRVQHPEWTVVVEQPTSEAYAATHRLERQLLAAICLALLGTV